MQIQLCPQVTNRQLGHAKSRNSLVPVLQLCQISWRESHVRHIVRRLKHNLLHYLSAYFLKGLKSKIEMDAFLRGQTSSSSSSKLKQAASEESAGPSSRRVVVPWVEK